MKKSIVAIFIFLMIINFVTPVCAVINEDKSEKIILIDPGHGGIDGGAKSKNGTIEKDINLQIAIKLKENLEDKGYKVYMTRECDEGLYKQGKTVKEKKREDLKKRVDLKTETNCDIFVSIHLNKIPQSQYYGWQTFFKKDNENSIKLAKSIQSNLNNAVQRENKRESLAITGKYIIDNVEIPTTIVECGFLSNPEEEALLQTDEYQNKLAWGIYNGIMDYFYE